MLWRRHAQAFILRSTNKKQKLPLKWAACRKWDFPFSTDQRTTLLSTTNLFNIHIVSGYHDNFYVHLFLHQTDHFICQNSRWKWGVLVLFYFTFYKYTWQEKTTTSFCSKYCCNDDIECGKNRLHHRFLFYLSILQIHTSICENCSS